MRNRKKPIERLKKLSEVKKEFDINFWQEAGVLARFAATWQMLKEFYKMRGRNGNKFRLQRFIQHIEKI